MLSLTPFSTRNLGPRLAAASLAIAAIALGAAAQGDFAVSAGYEAGKIAVRDARDAGPIVMQRNLPLWEDNAGGQSLAPTIEFVPQQTGYDLIYTFTNTSSFPKKQGQMRVGVFTLGSEVRVLDGGFKSGNERLDKADGYKVYARYYPLNMYSPVWMLRDSRYAVGVSVQYPVLEYQHDLRFSMRRSAGATASGEGGVGWWVEIRLSNNLADTPDSGLRYEAMIPPGETRRYVVSVRATNVSNEWMRTLTPYRTFFRSTYGGVRYERKPMPINAVSLAVDEAVSNENPYGWNRHVQRSPDVHGWGKWVDDLSSRSGWSGFMLWKPTGVFKNNQSLNFPFQFTSRWLENENMRTALDSRNGLPSLIRKSGKKELGLWWGRACQVMTAWDDGKFEPLDPDNPAHVQAALKEMGLAAQAGATIIGLDTFNHRYTPTWKLYTWLQRLQFIHPQMRFIIEPVACDIMHTLAPMWLRGFDDKLVPESVEELYQIKSPHYMADFLLPGHEFWAGFRYYGHTRYFGIEVTQERIHNDMRLYASYGHVPVFFVDGSLTDDSIRAAKSWLTSVPADLQISESEWRASPAPGLTIGMSGSTGLVDEQTLASDQSNQLPGSGMGETPGSRLQMGPQRDGAPPMSLMMQDNSGRGPTINHSDVARALQRAAMTRTGGLAAASPNLPAQIRTGNQTNLAPRTSGVVIYSGRAPRQSTVVVAGNE
ncbi:MAG: hypothetical protein KIT19_10020 [Phycisphaeraceae bacterium]|nr:hypothetical protein [Phycisphaeraceae bacterium]